MAALPDRDKLLRNFSRCANWEEKYLYIIELGQRLAPLSRRNTPRRTSFRAARARCGS